MNYFMYFLQEKSSYLSREKLKKLGIRSLFYPVDFYKTLTRGDHDTIALNMEDIKKFTNIYSKTNNTIFDVFDQLYIPIVTKHKIYSFAIISLKESKFYYYECSGEKLADIAFNNKILINLSKYIQKEYGDRVGKFLDLFKWDFAYGNFKKIDDISLTGLNVCRGIYLQSSGNLNINGSVKQLMDFKNKMVKLIFEIGITNDLPGDLTDFKNLPL